MFGYATVGYGQSEIKQSYFSSYLPNYFGFSYEEDEPHIEFLVSLKYPNVRGPNNQRSRQEFFGSYSGLYDFYLFTRHSAPVISRMQNVGLHYVINFFA